MGDEILVAKHGSPDSPLVIGGIELECYVLENEQRVLVSSGMIRGLNIQDGNSSHRRRFSQFLDALGIQRARYPNIQKLVDEPIRFIRPGKGGVQAVGYPAESLPEICNAVIELQQKMMLPMDYRETAERCLVLLNGFATVGIIALVDEATGYQAERNRDALQKILDRYLYEKHAAWAKRFPDEFYREIFRLRGWEYEPDNVRRPAVIGTITKDIVYKRLAPGILEELESRNPPISPGRRRVRHHQFLTDDIGHPELHDHIIGLLAIMRTSDSWPEFRRQVAKAYPVLGEQHLLDLYRDIPEEELD